MVDLGQIGGATQGGASAVSADGATVVGISGLTGTIPFRWTQVGGMQLLAPSAFQDVGGSLNGVSDISGDGAVAVGSASVPGGQWPYRWTAATGKTALLPVPVYTVTNTISGDGNVIVGYTSDGYAARYTDATGLTLLTDLLPARGSFAQAVSHDGQTIAGYYRNDLFQNRPFFWTASSGMVDLQDFLSASGIDMSGWDSMTVTGISADGLTLVGQGMHQLDQEGWIATVPEPTGVVGVAGLAGRLLLKRRKKLPTN
jgi:uncharacterized membrane protein